jgi:hypothetical protein
LATNELLASLFFTKKKITFVFARLSISIWAKPINNGLVNKMEFHKFRVGIDFIWKTTYFTSTRVRDRSEKPTATRSPSGGLRGLVADSPTPFVVE